jgi:hypothetical protein
MLCPFNGGINSKENKVLPLAFFICSVIFMFDLSFRRVIARYEAIFDLPVAYLSIGDCFVPRNDAVYYFAPSNNLYRPKPSPLFYNHVIASDSVAISSHAKRSCIGYEIATSLHSSQ